MSEPVAGDARADGGPGPTGGLEAPAPDLVAVRATVNQQDLAGQNFRAGEVILVDLNCGGNEQARADLQGRLAAQFLVPLPAKNQPGHSGQDAR